jgi:hypothetical protein
LVGRAEGKRPVGRPKLRWKNSARTHLNEIRWGVDGFMWLRIEISGGSCEDGKEHQGPVKAWAFLE